ncbi:MAG: hypothetical protein OEY23_01040 [Acidimicrobiia bacterium]|nr:hypothetical protein [Acidimicrobiia bacterium]
MRRILAVLAALLLTAATTVGSAGAAGAADAAVLAGTPPGAVAEPAALAPLDLGSELGILVLDLVSRAVDSSPDEARLLIERADARSWRLPGVEPEQATIVVDLDSTTRAFAVADSATALGFVTVDPTEFEDAVLVEGLGDIRLLGDGDHTLALFAAGGAVVILDARGVDRVSAAEWATAARADAAAAGALAERPGTPWLVWLVGIVTVLVLAAVWVRRVVASRRRPRPLIERRAPWAG